MGIFTIFTVLIVLSAIFGFLNIRFLKMPNTIGMMLISICFTALLSILGRFYQPLDAIGKEFIGQIDFSEILLDVMLSFLLFAGSLHTKWAKLKAQRLSILLLSTLGVLMSTFLIGTAFYYLVLLFGLQIDFIFALIFLDITEKDKPFVI